MESKCFILLCAYSIIISRRFPDSKLSKMFSGSIPIVLDTLKQHYFIDRSVPEPELLSMSPFETFSTSILLHTPSVSSSRAANFDHLGQF